MSELFTRPKWNAKSLKIQRNIFSKFIEQLYYFAFESLQCNSVSIQVAE